MDVVIIQPEEPSCYSCERNHRPPAHSLFATLDPLLPVPVMAELLEYCRKETMGEETSFAHSCTAPVLF